jgi:hypothetical protein
MIENWLPIEGYEGLYEVSNQGRVRSLPRPCTPGGIIATSIKDGGRPQVSLYKHNKRRHKLVSVLVAEAFIGPRNGRMVLHWDDTPTNNTPGNLRYGGRKDNLDDAIRNGRIRRGARHGMAKLSPKDVVEIRKLLLTKMPQSKIAEIYGVTRSTVLGIHLKKNWGWLK